MISERMGEGVAFVMMLEERGLKWQGREGRSIKY